MLQLMRISKETDLLWNQRCKRTGFYENVNGERKKTGGRLGY